MSLAQRFRLRILTAGDLSGFKEEIMKLFRVILVCTLLLSAAVPAFAAPPCQFCLSESGPCVNDPGGLRCRTIGGRPDRSRRDLIQTDKTDRGERRTPGRRRTATRYRRE